MPENEGLKPFEETANAITETSWDREKRAPEFQQIKRDLEALRQKVGERKPAFTLTQEGPIPDMAYEATAQLLGAAAEVLIDPDTIADAGKEHNSGRAFVTQKLARVLEELHISPDDLAAARQRVQEQRANNPEPEWPWPGPAPRDTTQ
jgi:hypothetical protein